MSTPHRFMPRLVAALLACLCLVTLSTPAVATPPPGRLEVQDLVELKRMGYGEAAIGRELSAAAGVIELSEADAERLRQEGFSAAFIASLRAGQAAARLDNAAVVRMLEQKRSLADILATIRDSERDFDAAPLAMLDLHRRHGAPKWLIRAMRGQPLTLAELEAMGRDELAVQEQLLLLEILGVETAEIDTARMLELLRAGVAGDVLRQVRDRSLGEDLPRAGHYPHPLGLFTLRYPAGWKLLKEAEGESVLYLLTPQQDAKRADDIEVGLQLMVAPVEPGSMLAEMTPRQALEQILPMVLQQEPGLRRVGDTEDVRLGDLAAARCRLGGSVSGKSGRFSGELTMLLRDGRLALLVSMAPEDQLAGYSASFAEILAQSSFLAPVGVERRDAPMQAQQLVAERGRGLVSITKYRGDKPLGTGSGFIIREDGYLLTNHHVIWDSENDQPATRFTVEWDAELRLPKQEAQLVGYRYTSTYQGELLPGLSSGIDIALLKLPAGGDYAAMPLLSSREVRLADPVLTLGFPARGLIQTLSTVVTSGIVTRLNRDFTGRLESIYIDAPIAHGSSGGPTLNLMSGRVFGLNTFGAFGISGVEDLWNYFGVIPIDYALDEFPIATRVSAQRDAKLEPEELYDLALQARARGATDGAMAIARRTMQQAPEWPGSHYLAGRLQLEQAATQQDIDAGLARLEHALELDPAHLPSLLFLAQAKLQLGETQQAQAYAARAVQAHADDPDAYETQALVNLAARDYQRALADLDQAKQLTQRVIPSPYLLAGEVYYAMKHYGEGRKAFEEALGIHPANLQARIGIARYYGLTDQPIKALLEYGSIEREMPGHPEVLQAMADTYLAIAKPDKALDSYVAAIDRAQKLGMRPTPESYLGGARAALSEGVDQPATALTLYLALLAGYWGEDAAFDGHLGIARVLADTPRYQAVARGHLAWAQALRAGDPDAAALLRQVAEARLSLQAIRDMVDELGYPAIIAGLIVRETPLDFQVEPTQKSMDELQKVLPGEVALAILLSQEKHGQATAPRGEAQGAIPAGLVGSWAAPLQDEASGRPAGELRLDLEASGHYLIEVDAGQEAATERGSFRVAQEVLRLTSEGGEVSEYRYTLQGGRLVLNTAERQQVVFVRRR